MGAYAGSVWAGAEVTGATAQTIVKVGEAFTLASVSGRNASFGGLEGFTTYRPWFGLQGSTEPVPGGASWSAADVTGDGKPDLVWKKYPQGKFVVMPGLGNRTFGAQIEHTSAGEPLKFAAADFNADGKPDPCVPL